MRMLMFVLIGAVLVFSASPIFADEKDEEIRALEKRVAELKAENDRLKKGLRPTGSNVSGNNNITVGGNVGTGVVIVGGNSFNRESSQVVGSGKEVSKSFDLSDFTAVDVSTAFKVEITQGKTFAVAVVADDNVMEHIRVEKKHSTLHIALDTVGKSYRVQHLRVSVTMPTLRGVSLNGASAGTVAGFKSVDDLRVEVRGASSLSGSIDAGKIRVNASGASTVDLKGTAAAANLEASGASKLRFADYQLGVAEVDLSGASRADVKVTDKIGYDLSGASRLAYSGRPMVVRASRTGASSVIAEK